MGRSFEIGLSSSETDNIFSLFFNSFALAVITSVGEGSMTFSLFALRSILFPFLYFNFDPFFSDQF
ncbi:hypothetical protein LEP1GSC133_3926 [Leptospira borgpetersenii serovar Pomona str. 200901868]|uniref:Uncharacterized protein n=2 Tax=Leptospira borgpetersenii TaxID=174 RepID=M3HLD5_LEPBO|nr:hypothetical protein LEP1GSC123_3102 [Leptospira borgpetersenii str. 200701203]EMO64342.1 hypothetical protein LEP1GSC133_3926 [Leptospira borgpetersenii serovar Pomona str. 200901868]